MNETCEILWRMYQEHCNQSRHHETLRATTSNILLAVAGGVMVIAVRGDNAQAFEQILLALLVVAIGVFGAPS